MANERVDRIARTPDVLNAPTAECQVRAED